ncbi:MAG: hypothetical protein RLZZ356_2129, partial [Verrucomicrobiota bacterium]
MSASGSSTRSASPESLRFFALVFGAFLGLCILKWGNPVILDGQIPLPRDAAEWLQQPWPSRLAAPVLMVLAVIGVMTSKPMEALRGRRIPALLLI